MSTGEFTGRTVLITGGGGGIGYATAQLLTERGATVVALGPDDPGLKKVAGLPRTTAVPGDAADENDVRRAVDTALLDGGRLDAVVCCAGLGTFGTVLDSEPGWQDTLRANLDTAYVTTRIALPALIDTGGAVVLVSSLAGTLAVPAAAAYTTSKHALIGLTRSLAADFGPLGVRANVICPGAVRTPMLDRVMDEIGSRSGQDRDTAYRRAGSLVPLRRAAEPSEIAEVIAFLAGPRSAVVTGAVLMADCGVSAVDLSLSPLDQNLS
ncbi:SDR family NAD(P)-dependent oxidoreductase [Streptomyces sp. NPDC006365]|uniref:SDR family NAD(P)-dependent oxidoreductase n=1 Tax=Streptomyces sp. NPDC006365 TaxID=3364744 RepID=UPI00367991DD